MEARKFFPQDLQKMSADKSKHGKCLVQKYNEQKNQHTVKVIIICKGNLKQIMHFVIQCTVYTVDSK